MSKAQREAEARRRNTRVTIGWIHPGHVDGDFMDSVASLMLAEARPGGLLQGSGYIGMRSGPRIAEARTQLVETFLTNEIYKDVEWLFMVDSDMTFEPDAVRRLLNAAHPIDRPIMGGLCFAGSGPHNMYPTVYSLEPAEEEGWTTEIVRDYPEDAVVKVGATGAAAMLVHRGVFLKMYEHFHLLPSGKVNNYPWFVEGHVDAHGRPFGEDVAFCIKAQAIGIPVHIHTGVEFGHRKQITLDAKLWKDNRP